MAVHGAACSTVHVCAHIARDKGRLRSMAEFAMSDASMRVDRHHRVLIKLLPQAAWRLLIDYLMFDRWFCNAAIPYFRPLGYVVLCIYEPLPHGDGSPYSRV